MKRLPLVTVVALLAAAVVITVGFAAGAPGSSPRPSDNPAARGGSTPPPSATASTPPVATPTPEPTPTPTPTPVPLADVPIVPVTHFRTTADRTNRDEVQALLAGSSERYGTLELVASEADAILQAIGVERPADDAHLLLLPDAEALSNSLASNRKHLGFLRAGAVGPGVRALAWGDNAMFGVGRVKALDAWTLTAELPEEDGTAFDPAGLWTLVAGGDILLDRGVAQTVKVNGKGVDFPFDGGTAEITGHTCCSGFGWEVPVTRRTGNGGAMRALISGADLAIANFENPAPDRFRYHTSGTVFSADPALIEGLKNAGIDWVSLANNHIGDAGRNGILQTIDNLAEWGIKSGGAGYNASAARRPTILEANGVKVGIIGYDSIAPGYRAGSDSAGSASFTEKNVISDVKKARDSGAQVVIVFPHWGTEYDPTPFTGQQALARAAIDAGADMVIGNHAHWAGALEVYEGKPIWYALGNFIFDQTWSEPTMEGMTLELTFDGAELVQARMRPHIILDKAQPNFLDPAGDGRVVMGQVFDASKGLLPW
ncbi:MAG TPA: CapA family protein [Candidatus Limnocylindrales bacterium]|nr:CapA family protein [Candidatus Limnocylindrales bacterium]